MDQKEQKEPEQKQDRKMKTPTQRADEAVEMMKNHPMVKLFLARPADTLGRLHSDEAIYNLTAMLYLEGYAAGALEAQKLVAVELQKMFSGIKI